MGIKKDKVHHLVFQMSSFASFTTIYICGFCYTDARAERRYFSQCYLCQSDAKFPVFYNVYFFHLLPFPSFL